MSQQVNAFLTKTQALILLGISVFIGVLITAGIGLDSNGPGYVLFRLIFFTGIPFAVMSGTVILIKAIIRAGKNSEMETELLREKYYQAEAKRRLDEESVE